MKAPPSWLHLNLINSQRPHLQIPPHWGLGSQHLIEFRGDPIQSITVSISVFLTDHMRPSLGALILRVFLATIREAGPNLTFPEWVSRQPCWLILRAQPWAVFLSTHPTREWYVKAAGLWSIQPFGHEDPWERKRREWVVQTSLFGNCVHSRKIYCPAKVWHKANKPRISRPNSWRMSCRHTTF